MKNNKQIKVLYIISSFMKCGPINMLYTLLSNLDRQEFDVSVVTLKQEPANSRIQDFRNIGVNIYTTSKKSSHFLFGLRRSLQKVVNDIQPDIVHSHGPWADYYLGGLVVNRSVMSIHNKLAGDYLPLYGPILGSITAKLDSRAMRKADLSIAVSNAVAKTAKDDYKIESVVIYNGVDTDGFSPCNERESRNLREKLGINPNAYVFLHIGNLIKRKQPKFMADAFKEAIKINPNMELIFLGDGPLFDEVQDGSSECKNIRFLGNVDNVADYMKASNAMVSATTSDGLSMATLEGLACGLKGLMSDIDVHREIRSNLIDNPDDFVICSDCIESYAEGYLKLAKTAKEKNSVNKESLAGSSMAKKYADCYKHILGIE